MAIYALHQKSREAFGKLTLGTVAHAEHLRGMRDGEPVIVALDALLRYALAYQHQFGSVLATDGVLGDDAWLPAIKGVRALLNGHGHFDGGVCEDIFWAAIDAAGYTEADV